MRRWWPFLWKKVYYPYEEVQMEISFGSSFQLYLNNEESQFSLHIGMEYVVD